MRTQSACVAQGLLYSPWCAAQVVLIRTVRRVMSQSDPRVAHKQNNNSSSGFYPADFTTIIR